MTAPDSPASFWNRRYQDVERLWSAEPNALLTGSADELEPDRALDLGAGEGRNAIWLAGRGWRVTALDVSSTALDRAAKLAAPTIAPFRVPSAKPREPRRHRGAR